MKAAATHLADKPGHAVDLDTGAVVAAELHPADEGDTTTLFKTLAAAEANLKAVAAVPTPEGPAECVADKGYHSRAVLKALDDSPWKTRIAEPRQKGFSRWHGDEAARRAVTLNPPRERTPQPPVGWIHRSHHYPVNQRGMVGRSASPGNIVIPAFAGMTASVCPTVSSSTH